jgi:hypothetical protein
MTKETFAQEIIPLNSPERSCGNSFPREDGGARHFSKGTDRVGDKLTTQRVSTRRIGWKSIPIRESLNSNVVRKEVLAKRGGENSQLRRKKEVKRWVIGVDKEKG